MDAQALGKAMAKMMGELMTDQPDVGDDVDTETDEVESGDDKEEEKQGRKAPSKGTITNQTLAQKEEYNEDDMIIEVEKAMITPINAPKGPTP